MGILEVLRNTSVCFQAAMPTSAKSKLPSKTSQVSATLRRMARDAGPDGKLPTHSALLRQFGVSGATLNAALDELETQRVIYRRHGVGIFAAPRLQKATVALACNPGFLKGASHSPFWDLLLREAQEHAEADDISCEIHFCKLRGTDELPFSESLSHALAMGHVQGMLSVGMNRAVGRWLSERHIPHVAFGGPGTFSVGLDIGAIIEESVQVLVRRGCRRIALLSPVQPFRRLPIRDDVCSVNSEVFRMALARHGLSFDARLVKEGDELLREGGGQTNLLFREQGYLFAKRIFDTVNREVPDGLVITDDMMALGVLAALRECQLEVGEDVQIASHTNRGTAVFGAMEASIVRLEIDPAEIVQVMFSTMMDLLSGKKAMPAEISPRIEVERTYIKPLLRMPEISESIGTSINSSAGTNSSASAD